MKGVSNKRTLGLEGVSPNKNWKYRKGRENGSLANLTNGVIQTTLGSNGGQSTTPSNDQDTRFTFDLGSLQAIAWVSAYSSHDSLRTTHKFNLFAATGAESGFDASPAIGIDPTTTGYTLLTTVTSGIDQNGQHDSTVFDDTLPTIGTYRYFLVETLDAAGSSQRTNYGEIDIIAVPEPGTTLLIAFGALGFINRRSRK